MKLCWLSVSLLVALSQPAVADDTDDVVLVYDRKTNEIACWYTGALQTGVDCSKPAFHPATDGFWVYENVSVYIQIINSTFADDYTVEVTATAQPEATEHVFGALTEVPKIKLFDTDVTVVPGAAAVAVAGHDPVTALIEKLTTLDDAQLKAALADLQSLNQDKAAKLLAVDLGFTIPHLATSIAALQKDATTLKADSKKVLALSDTPDKATFADRIKETNELLDKESKLRADADARDVTKEMRQVLDAYPTALDSVMQRALNADPKSVDYLAQDLKKVPLSLSGKDFVDKKPANDPNALFPYIMKALSKGKPLKLTQKEADRLAANLQTLAKAEPALEDLARDLRYLQKPPWATKNIEGEIEAVITAAAALRADTEQLTLEAIQIAQQVNDIMRTTPLSGTKARLYLGRWDGNQAVTYTLKRAGRAPRYSYAGARSTASKVFTDAPEQKDVTSAPDAPVTAVQATFRVRALYRFQITAGFVMSTMSADDFELVTNDVEENGTKTTQRFFVQSRNADRRYFPSLNLVWYPWKRDLQHRTARYSGEKTQSDFGFGFMAGLNLADPSRDALLGISITHISGAGIAVGADVGYEHVLPKGVGVGVPITNAVVVKDHLTTAFFASVTLSSQFLKDFVGLVFK